MNRFLGRKICFGAAGDGAGSGGGDGAGAGGDGGTGSLPMHTPEPIVGGEVDIQTLIPAEYKEKEYLKDVTDVPGLFKKLDGAQTLIGKRPAGIPQDNASDEEWQEFNKSFGVPEKAEEYDMKPTETNPMPDEMIAGVKGVFHKAGLSKRQAAVVEAGWNELMSKQGEAGAAAAKAQDADFDALAGKAFGERKTEALATSKALLETYAPDDMKTHINDLSNENLIVMASVIDAIRSEFISEDQLPAFKGGKSTSAVDNREEARKLMASDAYTNPFHAEHDATKKRVDALYAS